MGSTIRQINYYISQLVRVLWLVHFADCILLYVPPNLKVSFPTRPILISEIPLYNNINILLTSFSWSTLQITDPHFFPLIYGPRTSPLGHKWTGKDLVHNLTVRTSNSVSRRYVFIKISLQDSYLWWQNVRTSEFFFRRDGDRGILTSKRHLVIILPKGR